MIRSTLQIIGVPVTSFEFIGLPSVNTHYNKHFRARAIDTAEWKTWAEEEAGLFMWENPDLPRPIINRALVVVNFYPPYEEISDCHNIHIKPLLDGFTNAGLWNDDEWSFVPLVLFAWAGIGEQKPRQHKVRKTILDIYELDSYIINGMFQRLPKGRFRNDI